jgi:hypothetical protein
MATAKTVVTFGCRAAAKEAPLFTMTIRISGPLRFRMWLGVLCAKAAAWLCFGRVDEIKGNA